MTAQRLPNLQGHTPDAPRISTSLEDPNGPWIRLSSQVGRIAGGLCAAGPRAVLLTSQTKLDKNIATDQQAAGEASKGVL
jgi:hypothetical protein